MSAKVAFITQSYKDDFEECSFLCESIDRFAPDIDHFIFVNDEDYKLFKNGMSYKRHKVFKKSSVLPWYLIRIPFKIMGHHFHLNLFGLPVREWIIQQICKLGVFEVIGNEYDAVFNVDSEIVLMKPLDLSSWIQGDKYMLYRTDILDVPGHSEFCSVAEKLFDINRIDFDQYAYMAQPVCFEKQNLSELLCRISRHNVFHSWKLTLCNTYRFSEFYLYSIFCIYKLKCRNHFVTNVQSFPILERPSFANSDAFYKSIETKLEQNSLFYGLCFQKKSRKTMSGEYISFDLLKKAVVKYWDSHNGH
ncbi:MAG: DUF6492 family protein [Bacteroidales bacterium]|nr:DUF6492 family protein [Bacteroidales bacterium]